ncbi:porin [Massilia yuzhufengensis]|uniref:Porin n=1 Tax=Massilia yuzhufengensis TaxID=1164594 RepID=A0A1I1JWH9_9BURK|nr:porin [Massilia yuzhufengensis]SFC50838.1 porin [Massilia yuzhufengensis]
MKMSIVACAVLGASAACASAQNTGAPSRSANAGVAKETRCTSGCATPSGEAGGKAAHAGAAGSRVGDGPAIFTLETSHEADLRRAHEHEALTVGRQYSLEFLALTDVGDPFHGGLAGSGSGAAGARRTDDSVTYQSQYNGFSAGSSWGKGDVDGSPSGRAWGMTVGFNAGPINIRAAHQNRNVAKITRYDQVGISMAAKNSIIAANMRFGWGTAYAAYSASRGWGSSPLFNPDNPYGAGITTIASTDSRDVLAGVAVPLSRCTTLLASYIRKNDRDPANRDARQMAIGATYSVSRSMDFYAAYSNIRHLSGIQNASVKTGGGSAINIGMRRAF